MKHSYESIEFDRFSDLEEENLSSEEKARIFEHFCTSARIKRKKKGQLLWVAAACVCVIAGILLTPVGANVSAAVKQMVAGIGEHLGMTSEDQYATTINQSKTIGKTEVTLNEAVADHYNFRFSMTVKTKDGAKIQGKDIEVYDITVNGKRFNGKQKGTGYAYLGNGDTENGKQHFLEVPFRGETMPRNPKIHLEIIVWKDHQEHILKYDFVLKNEKMLQAQREINLNQTIEMNGEKMLLGQLIVTPIGQRITIQNSEDLDAEEFMELKGTDNLGNQVVFLKYPEDDCFIGYRENKDQITYELDPDVTTYCLYTNGGKELKIQVR